MPLANWTINGKTVESLGVEDVVSTRQNMDDDFDEFVRGCDFDAAPGEDLAFGAAVVVMHGDTVTFRGKIEQPNYEAAGVERQRIVAYGPWHFLAQTPYLYNFPYYPTAQQTTHAMFKGSAGAIMTGILAQAIAAGIISSGSGGDIGTAQIPPFESYDLSLADAIRSVLRYIPGSHVAFNYATDPPTMFVLPPSSEYLTVLAPPISDCSDVKIRPRHDLVLDGVRIDYEAREVRKTRTWNHVVGRTLVDTTEVTHDGFRVVASDSAGATSGRVLRKTIPLSGSRTVTTVNWTVGVSSVSLGHVLWHPTETWQWLNTFMGYNCPRHPADLIAAYAAPATIAKLFSFSIVSDGSSTLPTNYSTGSSWFMLTKTWTGSYTGPVWYDNVPLRRILDDIMLSDSYPDGICVLKAEVEWQWTDDSAGSGTSKGEQYFIYAPGAGGLNRSGSREIVEGEVEETPTGIASAILASRSELTYDGSVTVLLEDSPESLLGSYGLRRKISFASPSFTSPIQRFVFTASTGLAAVSFGTPVHLGPQDLLALYRVRK